MKKEHQNHELAADECNDDRNLDDQRSVSYPPNRPCEEEQCFGNPSVGMLGSERGREGSDPNSATGIEHRPAGERFRILS